ncbi:MAG TPA: F0F1 ATP synthase subunit gamma [Spirochaetia bacterium]|nr:F0F1 ATP synthase subunit gamma [Spirochaetia bacterium]
MKSLAAVNVRIFGQARDAIENYMDGVERALQIAVTPEYRMSSPLARRPAEPRRLGLFVFGAVQGMCGQFNDHAAEHAARYARRFGGELHTVAVGPRIGPRLVDRSVYIERSVEMTGSLERLPGVVDDCIVAVDQLQRKGIGRVVVVYNTESGHASYEPHHELMLPISEAWLGRLARRSWPTREIPRVMTDRASLLAALTRQYLFASFYRAVAQSLASENAARLSSMQSAESNIDDRLEELRSAYNRQRQQEITSELLDIVGGYSALSRQS